MDFVRAPTPKTRTVYQFICVHLMRVNRYTPAFQQAVMVIASPLALLVALWGMSSVREIDQMPDAQEHLRMLRGTL